MCIRLLLSGTSGYMLVAKKQVLAIDNWQELTNTMTGNKPSNVIYLYPNNMENFN